MRDSLTEDLILHIINHASSLGWLRSVCSFRDTYMNADEQKQIIFLL